MKLIDILVERLPALGGWPIDSDDERTLTSSLPGVSWGLNGGGYYAFRGPNDSITYQQYEAARLSASKPEWDGEGLPPVGVNAEVLFADDTEPKWYSFLAKYIGENHVVALVGLEEVSYKISELCTKDVKFAPVRSEEDRKRDESVIAIYDEYLQCATVEKMKDVFYALYDAIAAGKIPHIRID
ncbi:TPA: hypothetical protein HLU32_19765 [Escherichia coli]|nr:hypothetical protein [Escherichia coli]HAJ4256733.1 hypothetical protein [Escherichia coli]HAJ4383636.1 hypothetical protein [Escherichia coli]